MLAQLVQMLQTPQNKENFTTLGFRGSHAGGEGIALTSVEPRRWDVHYRGSIEVGALISRALTSRTRNAPSSEL